MRSMGRLRPAGREPGAELQLLPVPCPPPRNTCKTRSPLLPPRPHATPTAMSPLHSRHAYCLLQNLPCTAPHRTAKP